MHDARAISNVFIVRSIKNRTPITALSLLKILYFAHAWYLAKYEDALVAQPFEAWKFGPVVRVVYDQVKMKKKTNISDLLVTFDALSGSYKEADAVVDAQTKSFLEDIFDYYSRFDALKLSDLTHEPGSPWAVIWERAANQAVPGMRIPNEMIRQWFIGESARRSTRQKN